MSGKMMRFDLAAPLRLTMFVVCALLTAAPAWAEAEVAVDVPAAERDAAPADAEAANPEPADAQAPAAQPAIDKAPPRNITLDEAVQMLTQEAVASWRKDRQFPRTEPNFAVERNVRIPEVDVLAALTRRLHPHPAIDGYIKHQLLSFDPEIEQVTPQQALAIIKGLPPVLARVEPNIRALNRGGQPVRRSAATGRSSQPGAPSVNMRGAVGGSFSTGPDGALGFQGQALALEQAFAIDGGGAGFDPTLSVVNSGATVSVQGAVSADGRYVTLTVQAVNAQLVRLRQYAVTAANPTIALRDQVIDALPRDRGIRLAAMLMDVSDRIRAAHPTVNAASERMVAEARAVAADPAFPPAARRQLIDELKGVYRLRTATATQVRDGQGVRFGARTQVVQLPKEDYTEAMASLRGR